MSQIDNMFYLLKLSKKGRDFMTAVLFVYSIIIDRRRKS